MCTDNTRTIWRNEEVLVFRFILYRPIYLGYDLSFYHCISELYEALREYCPSLLLGEIKRSQNLSDSVKFETGYSKLGYHYFSTTSIDRDGILLFIGKDGIQCSNYYDNGNVYSMLVDSGISQSFVYADYQLQSIVVLYHDYH